MDASDEYVRFRCHMCGKRLKVRSDKQGGGQVLPCPRCREMLTVPLANLTDDLASATAEAAASEEVQKAFGSERAFKETAFKLSRMGGASTAGRRTADRPADRVPRDREEAGDEPSRAAAGRWRPSFATATPMLPLDELKEFRRKLDRIEGNALERACSVFGDLTATTDHKRNTLQRIGEERDNQYYDVYLKLRDDLMAEMKTLHVRTADLEPPQQKRLGEIRRIVESLDLYAFHVLGIEP